VARRRRRKPTKLVGSAATQSQNWQRLPSLNPVVIAAGKSVADDAVTVVHATRRASRLLAMTGQSLFYMGERI